MAQDNLSFSWELRGKVEEQIKSAAKNAEHLQEVIERLNVDLSKVSADKIQQNFQKNVTDAEKALYKLLDAKEKVDKALSRNASMRGDGFLGMDDSKLSHISARLSEIIDKVMNIGAEAHFSKTAVKDMLTSLSADIALKEAKSATSLMDKGLEKQVRERAKAIKEDAKEAAKAQKEAIEAAQRNAAAQEQVKNALARIATARANLSAASERGNQQEVAHAQLLMNLLDRLAGKLNSMKGTFLGEKGALSGVLGSGYQGLMRNVSAAIRDIGNVGSNIVQSPVKLIAEQDTSAIRNQIDLVGALHTQIKRLYEELGRAANNSGRIMPTNWQELAGKGLYNNKLPYVEQLEFLKKLRAYDGDMAKQRAVVEENIQKLQSQLNVYREAGINVQGYQNHLNALYETYVKLNALQTTDISAKLGLGHLRGYTGPQTALSDDAWASAKREAEIREVAAQAAEKHRQKLAELTEAFERQAKAEEKERQAQAQATAQKERATQAAHKRAQASAETQRNLNKEAGEVVRLRLEMLKTQAVQLQGIIKNGNSVFDAAQLEQYRNALRDIVREITTLKGVMDNLGSFTGRNGSGLMSFGSGTNYSPLIAHGQQALDASRAVNILSESERKFVESLTQTTASLRNQGVVLNDLRTLASQYLSLWGARSFLNSIIETGGLLEQQRLSIGAILGSMDKANNIFAKIKDLAVKSPFGVVELDRMSKQLTAYGFQYEELFDWTKRLADISAATGTEVSRLALALGHVRSEGALSGYTLRQFAMGNVPMLQKLAENLGISTKEVRERTKKKQISYEDVKEVLRQLTDEDGMFYNAQEVMSEALNAKYKNLRDAFDIMYGEIADSGVGDILKGIAEALTAGAKEWERFGTDILVVAGAFGVVKASAAAYSAGMIALSREMGVLALNTRAYTATQVQQLASEGAITREQLLRAVASGRLSVEQAHLAATTLGVSQATLQQAASSGTVTKVMLGNAMATSRYSVAQLRLMATLKAQGALFPVLHVGLLGVAEGVRAIGAAMKSFLPFLAIGAVVDLFSRYSQQMSSAKDSAQEAASTMSVGLGNIKSLYDTLTRKSPKDETEMGTAISNMKEALKEGGAYGSIQKQVEATSNLREQYDLLYGHLQKISEEYVRMKYNAEAYLEEANKVGGGWFSDNMSKDIQQYGQTVVKKEVAKSRADQYGSLLKKELEAYLKSEGKWVKEMQNASWEELLKNIPLGSGKGNLSSFRSYIERKRIIGGDKVEAKLYEDASEAIREYALAVREMNVAMGEVDRQMPEYAEFVKMSLNSFAQSRGLDVGGMANWSEEDLRAYTETLMQSLESLKIPEEAKQHIRDEIIGTYPKEVQVRIRAVLEKGKEEEQLTGWRKELQDYFDAHKINMKVSADDSIQAVEKRLQEARKKAQEKMDSAGAILTFWKVKPDMSAIEEFARSNPLIADLIRRVFGDYTEGKEEVGLIDQAHLDTGLTTKEDKNKGSGRKEDTQLKLWREEWSELKAFYSEFKKWAQQIGDDAALKKLRETGLWGQFFNADGTTRYDMQNWEKAIGDFRKKLSGGSVEREKFIFEVGKEQLTPQYDEAKKAADAILSQLDKALKERGKRWDLYKKVLDATGNRQQAGEIAFGSGVSFKDYAEELREGLRLALAENRKAQGLSVDELLGMDDETLRKLDIFKENTDGVYQKLQLLREEMQKVKAEEVNLLLEALKNTKNLDTELALLHSRYERTRHAIRGDKTMPQSQRDALLANADKNEAKETADLQWKYFKQTDEWGRVFGNLDKMSTATLGRMRDKLSELAPSVRDSVEATKALYEAINKIDKAVNSRNPFKAMRDAISRASSIRELLGSIRGSSDSDSVLISAETSRKTGIKKGNRTVGEVRAEAADELRGTEEDFKSGLNGLTQKFKAVQDALQPVIELFDQLGMTAMSDFFKMGSNALGAAAQMGGGVAALFGASAGPWGAAIGAGLSVVSSVLAMHDASLQREIEASKQRQTEMENLTKNLESSLERVLGGIYAVTVGESDKAKLQEYLSRYNQAQSARERLANGDYTGGFADVRSLQKNGYITDDTAAAISKAIESEEYFDTKLAELKIQRDEIQHQLEAEEDKKKKDNSAIESTKQQLVEMDDQIKHYALDMADALYSINLQDWASQLTDAIVGAWESGENAMDAYREKVKELMKDLTKNILAKRVLEQAFSQLGIDQIIANEMFDKSGKLNEGSIEKIADLLYQAGEMTTEAITKTLDHLDGSGYVDRGDGSSSSSSSSIKSITENTADLLVSYVNAIRADVSVDRQTLSQILSVMQAQSQLPVLAEAQLTQLESIAQHTARNAAAAEAIRDLLNGNINGTNPFRVR